MQAKVLATLRQGNYLEVAAGVAGITPQTLGRWLRDGADRVELDGTVTLGVEPYRSFRAAVQQVENEVEAELVSQWVATARTTPFGRTDSIEHFLNKRYRASGRWNEQTKVEVTGAGGGPIEVQAVSDSDYISGVIEAMARAGVLALPEPTDGAPGGPDAEDDGVHAAPADPDAGGLPPTS